MGLLTKINDKINGSETISNTIFIENGSKNITLAAILGIVVNKKFSGVLGILKTKRSYSDTVEELLILGGDHNEKI